ncbi:MAG TPA: S41 family peptidase [Bacteroidales bacterium]|nr:S41 family peptidase [Bacteroidales bacterium]
MKSLINTIIALLILTSCEKALIHPEYSNTAADNFECLWNNYDRNYGQFIIRNINWDSLYDAYRPQVDEISSEEELHTLFRNLLSNFHDDHVFLDPAGSKLPRIESGRSDTMIIQTDFLPETVSKYLDTEKQYSEHLWYGMLSGNIGYIRMDVFADSKSFISKAFDEVLKELENTKALVFDIRKLEGGDDRLAKYIAGRFTRESRLYMTTRKRNGPAHDDFETPLKWTVDREGSSQYIKPVVLLTGRFTASAGETFTWAMNENENVIQVGDTTLGAFSDIIVMELPNGWLHTVSVGDYRDAGGTNLEGTGIAPLYIARSSKSETLAGIDRGLEKALELLN